MIIGIGDTRMTKEEMQQEGYSACAIAMTHGGPVGSPEYTALMDELQPSDGTCPYCGEPCMGTGDCNCMEE